LSGAGCSYGFDLTTAVRVRPATAGRGLQHAVELGNTVVQTTTAPASVIRCTSGAATRSTVSSVYALFTAILCWSTQRLRPKEDVEKGVKEAA
jgi:hypothetical protein